MARVQGLDRPPFLIRAQLITPLDGGASRHLPDALIEVDKVNVLAGQGFHATDDADDEAEKIDIFGVIANGDGR